MDYLQGVLGEVAAWETLNKPQCEAIEQATLDPTAIRCLVILKAELLNGTVLVSLATSIANACVLSVVPTSSLRAIGASQLNGSSLLQAVTDQLLSLDDTISSDLCQRLQSYCSRLAIAQGLSRAYSDGVGYEPAPSIVDPIALADSWRRTCTAALALFRTIAQHLDTAGVKDINEDESRLISLLSRAEAGEYPCIDDDERINIPGWAERRREQRRQLVLPARAAIAGLVQPVLILDASANGLGMLATGRAGDNIHVALSNDAELTGTIKWERHGRIGVELDSQIDPDQFFRQQPDQ